MTNFKRYNLLHDEVMKRLEEGEITTEQAKEINDGFFDKYITEGVIVESSGKELLYNIFNGINQFKYRNGYTFKDVNLNNNQIDDITKKKIFDYKKKLKSLDNDVNKVIKDVLNKYDAVPKSCVSFNTNDNVTYFNIRKDLDTEHATKTYGVVICRTYVKINGSKIDSKIKDEFIDHLSDKLHELKNTSSIDKKLIPSIMWIGESDNDIRVVSNTTVYFKLKSK